jgi:MSHA biogenesis protein MshQ
VGQIRLQLKDPAALPQVIRGNSNAFVVKPASFVINRIETLSGVGNPGAATATGTGFVAAAAPFRVEVEARDGESSLTPSYGRETPAEGIRIASASLVVPAAGRNGSANDGVLGGATNFVVTATPGRFRNDTVTFDEMGIIRIVASVADGNYLSGGAVTGTLSGNVGRFYPALFALMAGATTTAACNTFTYMNQANLGLNYVLEARGVGGVRTRNYDLALLGAPALANVSVVAENADAGVNLGGRLASVTNPWVEGAVTVATTAASFARSGAPDGPFDSLRLGVATNDPLGNTLLTGASMNAATVGDCVGAGNCDAAQIGATTQIRYGRLMVKAAFGPETQNLPVPLEAQYFDGNLFRINAADVCTSYSAGQGALGAFTGNLTGSDTSLIAPAAATALIGGGSDPAAPLTLSAPGIGHDGSVDVTLDVAPYLEFDWSGGGDVDPKGTARFGRYRGHDRVIFWRER